MSNIYHTLIDSYKDPYLLDIIRREANYELNRYQFGIEMENLNNYPDIFPNEEPNSDNFTSLIYSGFIDFNLQLNNNPNLKLKYNPIKLSDLTFPKQRIFFNSGSDDIFIYPENDLNETLSGYIHDDYREDLLGFAGIIIPQIENVMEGTFSIISPLKNIYNSEDKITRLLQSYGLTEA